MKGRSLVQHSFSLIGLKKASNKSRSFSKALVLPLSARRAGRGGDSGDGGGGGVCGGICA